MEMERVNIPTGVIENLRSMTTLGGSTTQGLLTRFGRAVGIGYLSTKTHGGGGLDLLMKYLAAIPESPSSLCCDRLLLAIPGAESWRTEKCAAARGRFMLRGVAVSCGDDGDIAGLFTVDDPAGVALVEEASQRYGRVFALVRKEDMKQCRSLRNAPGVGPLYAFCANDGHAGLYPPLDCLDQMRNREGGLRSVLFSCPNGLYNVRITDTTRRDATAAIWSACKGISHTICVKSSGATDAYSDGGTPSLFRLTADTIATGPSSLDIPAVIRKVRSTLGLPGMKVQAPLRQAWTVPAYVPFWVHPSIYVLQADPPVSRTQITDAVRSACGEDATVKDAPQSLENWARPMSSYSISCSLFAAGTAQPTPGEPGTGTLTGVHNSEDGSCSVEYVVFWTDGDAIPAKRFGESTADVLRGIMNRLVPGVLTPVHLAPSPEPQQIQTMSQDISNSLSSLVNTGGLFRGYQTASCQVSRTKTEGTQIVDDNGKRKLIPRYSTIMGGRMSALVALFAAAGADVTFASWGMARTNGFSVEVKD